LPQADCRLKNLEGLVDEERNGRLGVAGVDAMIPATFLIVFAVVFVFWTWGRLVMASCERKMLVGDYDGALRRLRWLSLGVPNVFMLHKGALILSLAGRTAEAEPRYRKALSMTSKGSRYPRERLHASLGYALMDLGRYGEAEQCFHRAIETGDNTGNSQDGLGELRLAEGVETENALGYFNQAIEHAKRRAGGRIPGVYYAHRAWALALLGRGEEARESLTQGLVVREPYPHGRASLSWRAGMALLAMQQTEEARKHFQAGSAADPRGKYGCRCESQLRGAAFRGAA
jgi:tetratricopeptide (TPR) repeat protein